MKHINIIILSFVIFILSSCISLFPGNNNLLKDAASRNNTLMPFARNGALGYIDSETLEIIITEQYVNAGHFVGDFAVVEKKEGKPYIINKENKKVLGTFDHIALFDTENGEIVFALTGKNKDHRLYEYGGSGFQLPYWRRDPTSINYYLYNLNTGKMVMKLGKGNYPVIDDDKPRIRFLNNYILYDIRRGFYHDRDERHIYEIKNDGSVMKSEISIDELIAKIAKENNLRHIEKDFNFSDENTYDSWFGYFNTFDINELVGQLPDNMGIVRNEHDWRYKGGKPTLLITLFGDMTHPLKDKLLFQVYLRAHEKSEPFVPQYDGEAYTGLFNASENRWEILPVKGWRDFSYGSNVDWIIYDNSSGGDVFYNIKERKKYINTYIVLHKKYSGRSSPMAYYGYSKWAKDSLVEDF
jgi:hypothetical protein